MKKILLSILGLFCISFFNVTLAQAPTASGNVMNFSSVTSYEPYADNESIWSSLRVIAEQSNTLTTLAEAAPNYDDTLNPDFMREILNTDLIFQIGNYLIKVDLINDRGLIIAAGNANAYSDLVNNNLTASGMMVLNGDEDLGLDLLEALENNAITSDNYQSFLNAERACPGARRRIDKAIETWAETSEPCDIGSGGTLGRTYGMDNKVVYQKAIFYFSLQSKIRSVWRCTYGGSWTLAPINLYVDLNLKGNIKYRKRCESEVNMNADMYEGYYGGGDGILHWRPYSGGRSLSHYDFNVDFGIRPAEDRNPNPSPYILSKHYRIVWGY